MQTLSYSPTSGISANMEDPFLAAWAQGAGAVARAGEQKLGVRKANQADWALRLQQQSQDNDRWYRQQQIMQADKATALAQAQYDSSMEFRNRDLDVRAAAQQTDSVYKGALAAKVLATLQRENEGYNIPEYATNIADTYRGIYGGGDDEGAYYGGGDDEGAYYGGGDDEGAYYGGGDDEVPE